MHPHLTGNKVIACGPIIDALNECHERGFWTYYTGGCNDIRRALDKCLHAERVQRSTEHVREAKQKRKDLEKVWKENGRGRTAGQLGSNNPCIGPLPPYNTPSLKRHHSDGRDQFLNHPTHPQADWSRDDPEF